LFITIQSSNYTAALRGSYCSRTRNWVINDWQTLPQWRLRHVHKYDKITTAVCYTTALRESYSLGYEFAS